MYGVMQIIKYLLALTLLQTTSVGLHHVGYQRDARHDQRIHSNGTESIYSEWSPWSPCSHTCGVGISQRLRTCNKSPNLRNGASKCLGETIEHKICKEQACSDGNPGSRELQCSRFNNRLVAGQQRSWLPSNGGSNPCELRCTAGGMVSGFGKVADGTPCVDGVCLDGRCLKVGCDEKLGSGAEIDMCGICGGRNITCVHYKDIFYGQLTDASNQDRRSDYREVVVIPIGARNLEIRHRAGKNILAVRDRATAILYHGKDAMAPNERHIAGAIVAYATEDDNRTEVLRSVGPIVSELYVLVLLRERNQGIFYQYWIPLNQQGPPYYHESLPIPNHVTRPYQAQTTRRPFWSTQTAISPRYTTSYRFIDIKTTPQPQYRATPPYEQATAKLNYGPKRRGLPLPRLVDSTPSSPLFAGSSVKHFTSQDSSTQLRNNLPPVHIRNYRTQKPVYNYYEKFRNVSHLPPVNVYKRPEYLPHQTQGDASGSNGGAEVDRNIRHNPDKSKKHKKYSKFENLTRAEDTIGESPNLRWKYNINGKDHGKDHLLTTPVSIAVLPLPDTRDRKKSSKTRRKGGHHQSSSRLTRGESCQPCQRIRDQTKHFCTSDFVIRAAVLGYDFIHGETRYELEVLQSFKNTFPLLSKEYVWSPDTCRCPKLRIGKEYVLMGRSDNNYRRNESRLLVDRNCFVRPYNHKFARRLLRLRKNQAKKCSSKIS